MDLKRVNLHPYVDYKISNIMSVKGKFGFRVTLYYADGEEKICQHAGYEKKTEANKARNGVIAQLHTGIYVVYPNPDKPEPKFCQNAQDFVVKRLTSRCGNCWCISWNKL